VSAVIIAEMAAYYKDQGSSLYEALVDMYVEHGFFRERLVSVTKKGKAGAEEIQKMMVEFRSNPPATLGGSTVTILKDYQTQEIRHLVSGDIEPTNLPTSNVLQFITEDGSIISARPSGTEPKIKFYCSVNTNLASRELYDSKSIEMEQKIDQILTDLGVD
jgi:phosphoglucomutase